MITDKELIHELTEKYGNKKEDLLPVLQGIYKQKHHVSEEDMIEVARKLDISAAHIFGVTTFYSFMNSRPLGKYVIRVCKTITCSMHGKNQILKELERILKINVGETTPDKQFTLLETNCLGLCHKGPAMLINGAPYTELKPEMLNDILLKFRESSDNSEKKSTAL